MHVQNAFRVGTNTKLDDRIFAMEQCKTLPVQYLIQSIYPDLYPVHALSDKVRKIRSNYTRSDCKCLYKLKAC